MIFQRKYDRQIQRLREQNGGKPNDPSQLEQVMEKGDMPAMILSAMLVILPVCLIVLAGLAALGYFFIVR